MLVVFETVFVVVETFLALYLVYSYGNFQIKAGVDLVLVTNDTEDYVDDINKEENDYDDLVKVVD